MINPGTPEEKALPSRFGGFLLKRGDLVRLERPGGGGMGPASDRDPQKVLEDVVQGYVSRAAAESYYGVAIAETASGLRIDMGRTKTLRRRFPDEKT